jgi:hypothetical protein
MMGDPLDYTLLGSFGRARPAELPTPGQRQIRTSRVCSDWLSVRPRTSAGAQRLQVLDGAEILLPAGRAVVSVRK